MTGFTNYDLSKYFNIRVKQPSVLKRVGDIAILHIVAHTFYRKAENNKVENARVTFTLTLYRIIASWAFFRLSYYLIQHGSHVLLLFTKVDVL